MCKTNHSSKDCNWCLFIIRKIDILRSSWRMREFINHQLYYVSELDLKHAWRTSRGSPQNVPSFGPRNVLQLSPLDVPWKSPIYIFWIFVFSVKNSTRCVKQGILYLKNTFFIKSLIFVLVPWRSPGGLEHYDL